MPLGCYKQMSTIKEGVIKRLQCITTVVEPAAAEVPTTVISINVHACTRIFVNLLKVIAPCIFESAIWIYNCLMVNN